MTEREKLQQRDLRRLIGALALSLPFLCAAFAGPQQSVSAYYHTRSADILVGVLVAAGCFLVTYRGYDDADRRLSTAAGLSAILVALFPVSDPSDPAARVGFLNLPPVPSWVIHTAAACVLFAVLAWMALFQFTKGDSGTRGKRIRNLVYRACGLAIVAGLALAPVTMLVPALLRGGWLWGVEAWMLAAFGAAWLVKGETIFKDQE